MHLPFLGGKKGSALLHLPMKHLCFLLLSLLIPQVYISIFCMTDAGMSVSGDADKHLNFIRDFTEKVSFSCANSVAAQLRTAQSRTPSAGPLRRATLRNADLSLSGRPSFREGYHGEAGLHGRWWHLGCDFYKAQNRLCDSLHVKHRSGVPSSLQATG